MYLLQDEIVNSWELFSKLPSKFFIRFAVDIISVFVLIRFIYYSNYKTRELFFTFFIFNIIIFLMTFMMNRVEMSIGASFGLFAIFGMMRYRTENISTTDMTYLFLVIAMGLINAVMKGGWDELMLINIIVIVITLLLETNWLMKKELGKIVSYENIEMIKPENHQRLLEDLRVRTGLNIHRFSINKVDFLRDTAQIRVYYYANKKSDDISV